MRRLLRPRTLAATTVLALIAQLVLIAGFSSPAVAAPGLEITKLAPETIESGDVIEYIILYKCASTTENCTGAEITDVLPPELSGDAADVQVFGNSDTTAEGYDAGSRTVTFTFVDPLPAGVTGQVSIRAKFPEGQTLDGTTATNTATFTATNGDPSSSTVTTTASATPDWRVEKVASGGVIGRNSTYTVRLCNGGASGGIDLTDARMVDTLPPGVTFVTASGVHTYDAGAGTVTWDMGDLSVATTCHSRTITVMFEEPTFADDDVVTNSVTGWGTYVGDSAETEVGTATADLTLALPVPTTSGAKTVSPTRLGANGSGEWGSVTFSLSGTTPSISTPLDSIQIEDAIGDEFDVTSIRSGTNSAGLPATVEYETNLSGSYAALPGSPFAGDSTVTVASLGLGAGEWITQIRWSYGAGADSIPSSFSTSNVAFTADVLEIDHGGNPVVAPTSPANCSVITGLRGATATNTSTRCADVDLYDNVPFVALSKSTTTSGPFDHGDSVTYNLNVGTQSDSQLALTDPILVDLLPLGFDYVSVGTPTATGAATAGTVTNLTTIDDFDGTGRTLVRFQLLGGSFPAGTLGTVPLNTTVSPTAIAGPAAVNELYTESTPGPCPNGAAVTDADDLDGDGFTSDTLCRATSSSSIVSNASLPTTKWVQGDLDSAFSRFPDSGLAQPGGTANYELRMSNDGSVQFRDITIIDILPYVDDGNGNGDTEVLDETISRDSGWTTHLLTPITAPSGWTVSYSTSYNPCRAELNYSPAGCEAPGWSTTPPSPIGTVRSVKIESDAGTLLNPDDDLVFSFDVVVPHQSLPDMIAWNSFGYIATNNFNDVELLPSEPIKVGIETDLNPAPPSLGDFVWFDTDADGVQDAGEDGINGVTVRLLDGNGDPVLDASGLEIVGVTMTDADGNDGAYKFSNLDADTPYIVEFEPPDGFGLSPRNGTADTAADTNADPATGRSEPVTLTATEHDPTIDAGIFEAVSLGSIVWFDVDADGVQDASEAGLGSVAVALLDGTDDCASPVLDDLGDPITTTTLSAPADGNPIGYYEFTGLRPGSYCVGFDLDPIQGGAADFVYTVVDAGGDDAVDSDATPGSDADVATTEPVTLISAPAPPSGSPLDGSTSLTDPTLDAGVYTPVSLGSYVWIDVDADGEQDTDESGVAGVTVELLDGSGDPVLDGSGEPLTTVTDGQGLYAFTDLMPGEYQVKFTAPSGFSFTITGGGDATTDSDVTSTMAGASGITMGFTDVVTLVSAADASDGAGGPDGPELTNPHLDAGFVVTTGLGDFVWLDRDADGVQDDDEEGIAGVTVNLLDCAGEPVLDGGSTPITAVTNAGGGYVFADLTPGCYIVEFEPPAGYVLSMAGAGGDDAVDSDADDTSGRSPQITLVAGEFNPTIDAGIHELASLGDFVWEDTNGDGVQGDSEPGVPDVTVQLVDDDGTVLDMVPTDADGRYVFDSLTPGDYEVCFVIPDGYVATGQDRGGDDTTDSDGDPATGCADVVTLESGEDDPTIDQGIVRPAFVEGCLWFDTDADQSIDSDENPLEGVVVDIIDANGNVVDTATSGADGCYTFEVAASGTYTVVARDGLPEGAVLSTGNTVTVGLLAGQTVQVEDIGYTLAAGQPGPDGAAGGGSLPLSGSNIALPVGLAFALIVAGGALEVFRRRSFLESVYQPKHAR